VKVQVGCVLYAINLDAGAVASSASSAAIGCQHKFLAAND
jgi:hypothetical protein